MLSLAQVPSHCGPGSGLLQPCLHQGGQSHLPWVLAYDSAWSREADFCKKQCHQSGVSVKRAWGPWPYSFHTASSILLVQLSHIVSKERGAPGVCWYMGRNNLRIMNFWHLQGLRRILMHSRDHLDDNLVLGMKTCVFGGSLLLLYKLCPWKPPLWNKPRNLFSCDVHQPVLTLPA